MENWLFWINFEFLILISLLSNFRALLNLLNHIRFMTTLFPIVYIYIDTRDQYNLYPSSLTSKYIVSRTLGKLVEVFIFQKYIYIN